MYLNHFLCKKIKSIGRIIFESGQTNKQTDRQTDRQTDKQTDEMPYPHTPPGERVNINHYKRK